MRIVRGKSFLIEERAGARRRKLSPRFVSLLVAVGGGEIFAEADEVAVGKRQVRADAPEHRVGLKF
jgi:chemotaxis receptor (MCP) glutamine deamidase CheD